MNGGSPLVKPVLTRPGARSVPKFPWFRGESRGIGARRRHTRTVPFAGNIRAEQETHALLAMQKVDGSNPFSRFWEGLYLQDFFSSTVE
jgi:hypothetical protein